MKLLRECIRFFLVVLLSFNFLPYPSSISNYAFAQGVVDNFSLFLVGIKEDPDFGLRFVFKESSGESKQLNMDSKHVISFLKNGPVKFFLIALSLPNSQMWVNLSPNLDETDVLGRQLGKTDLGRMFLFYDLMLKKDAQRFMEELQCKSSAIDKMLAGLSDISVRFWIVPGRGLAAGGDDFIILKSASLSVDVEVEGGSPMVRKNLESLIREKVLPKLIDRVNNAKEYLGLRVIHRSIVLAQWYKIHKKNGVFSPLIDKGVPIGDLLSDKIWFRKTYLKRYLSMYHGYLVSDKELAKFASNMQLVVGGLDETNTLTNLDVEHTNSTGNLSDVKEVSCSWKPHYAQTLMYSDPEFAVNILLKDIEREYVTDRDDKSIIMDDEAWEELRKEFKEFIERLKLDKTCKARDDTVGNLAKEAEAQVKYYEYRYKHKYDSYDNLVPFAVLPKNSELIVVGDLHGDFENFKRVVEIFSSKIKEGKEPILVFLGDYIDGGKNSLAVLVGVLRLFRMFPKNVVVLRGNHESEIVSKRYGLLEVLEFDQEDSEVDKKKKEGRIRAFNELFLSLPHMAISSDSSGRVLFLAHGGVPVVKDDEGKIRSISSLSLEELFDVGGDVFFGLNSILWNDPLSSNEKDGYKKEGDKTLRGYYYFGDQAVGNNFVICAHHYKPVGYISDRIVRVFSTGGEGSAYENYFSDPLVAFVDMKRMAEANKVSDFVKIVGLLEDLNKKEGLNKKGEVDRNEIGKKEDKNEDNPNVRESKDKNKGQRAEYLQAEYDKEYILAAGEERIIDFDLYEYVDVILAPNAPVSNRYVLRIYNYSNLPQDWKDVVNERVGYFVIGDLDPKKDEFKGLRDGEVLIFGKGEKGNNKYENEEIENANKRFPFYRYSKKFDETKYRFISNRHVKITRHRDRIKIIDLNSPNGVKLGFVNKKEKLTYELRYILSKNAGKSWLGINYGYFCDSIKVVLAPTTKSRVSFHIFKYEDLPAGFDASNLNPEAGYFIVTDLDPRQSEVKELRDGEELVFGRGTTCDVKLQDDRIHISRRHVKVRREGDNLIITDLNSLNGTEVVVKVRRTPKRGGLNARFEIGKEMGPYGHKIAGGKSTGRGKNREIIVVDWDRDEDLQEFYHKIKGKILLDLAQRTYLNIGIYKGEILNLVFDMVEKIPYRDKGFPMGQEFLVGKAIKTGGCCRHKGIIIAAIIERLIKEKLLDGEIFYLRGPMHGFAVYQTTHGKLFVMDAAQKDKILLLDDTVAYKLSSDTFVKYVDCLPRDLKERYDKNKERAFYPDEANPFGFRGGRIGKEISFSDFDSNVSGDRDGTLVLTDRSNPNKKMYIPVSRYELDDVRLAIEELSNSDSQAANLLLNIWNNEIANNFEFYTVDDKDKSELKDFLGYGGITSQGKGMVFVSKSLLDKLDEETGGLLFLHELFEALLEKGTISIKFNKEENMLTLYVNGKEYGNFSMEELSNEERNKFARKLLKLGDVNHYLIYMMEQIDCRKISEKLTKAIRRVLKERGYKRKGGSISLGMLDSSDVEVNSIEGKLDLPQELLSEIYDIFINGKKEGALPTILSDLRQVDFHKENVIEDISVDDLLNSVKDSEIDENGEIIRQVEKEDMDIYRILKLFALLDKKNIGVSEEYSELYSKVKTLALKVFRENINDSQTLKKMISILSLEEETKERDAISSMGKGGIVFSLNELSLKIL